MTDYGHDLLFGTHAEPPAGHPASVVALAGLTERTGLDVVSIADHPYWPGRLDTIALLSFIAARTARVQLVANLFNLPLRSPGILAGTAATLDILTGGRFELGLAPGAQQLWAGIIAEGGPRRTAAESVEALQEAVQIIRALWRGGPDLHVDGRHYQLAGARTGPVPPHDIKIWIGAYQPRMLALTGRLADAVLPSSPAFPPERWPSANEIIDQAAAGAGRSPDAVRRVSNIAGEFSARGAGFLQGPPSDWASQLTELTLASGVSAYLLYRVSTPDLIERFAAEVAPAVREQVTAERGRAA
jgi:alkanesulfonate monooxygenase SsuD/methylene tetrahydromethanopterin reductase-like flavin-dependent oxidoreductase (luciferase family)